MVGNTADADTCKIWFVLSVGPIHDEETGGGRALAVQRLVCGHPGWSCPTVKFHVGRNCHRQAKL